MMFPEEDSVLAYEFDVFINAFQAWVGEMFALMADAPIEYRRTTKWFRQSPGRWKFLQQDIPLPSSLAYARAFYAESWTALDLAAFAPNLRPYFSDFVGTRHWSSKIDLRDFSIRTLDAVIILGRGHQLSLDNSALHQRITDLKAVVFGHTLTRKLTLFLDGVDSRTTIALDNSRTLEKLNDDSLDKYIPMALIPPTFEPGTMFDPIIEIPESKRWAYIYRILEPKIVTNALAFEAQDIPAMVDWESRNILDAISIATGVRPDMLGWVAEPENSLLASWWTSSRAGSIRLGESRSSVGHIHENHELTILWQSLLKAEKMPSHSLRVAARRIGDATARASAEDRLLDTTIALEAIFLQDHSPGPSRTNRIASRASRWLADVDGWDTDLIERYITAAFQLRNQLIHGRAVELARPITILGRQVAQDHIIDSVLSLAIVAMKRALETLYEADEFEVDWELLGNPRADVLKRLEIDREWYERNKKTIAKKYPDRYIAIVDRAVIDNDDDYSELMKRVRSTINGPVYTPFTRDPIVAGGS